MTKCITTLISTYSDSRKLPEKLRRIRKRARLTQDELASHVKAKDRASISAYERGVRQPPLSVLVNYAKLARVPLENLADDELDLIFDLAN